MATDNFTENSVKSGRVVPDMLAARQTYSKDKLTTILHTAVE